MMLSPLRPNQVIERQIDAAQRELVALIDMNPQFARRFFDLFLTIQDWEYAKLKLEIPDAEEDEIRLYLARLMGRKDMADELAEIRDSIVEEEKEMDDGN